jgi:uroporphyrinogen-III synthase
VRGQLRCVLLPGDVLGPVGGTCCPSGPLPPLSPPSVPSYGSVVGARRTASRVSACSIDKLAGPNYVRAMRASLIGVGPGEAETVSLRAVEVLSACDDIVVDAEVPEVCWKPRAKADARVTIVAEDEQEIGRASMVDAARAGRTVGRVRLGDGWRAFEALRDLRALRDAAVEPDVVPGVPATACNWSGWLDARPLYGRKIVITRTREQAEETAELLRERGAEPWSCPTIELAPPPDPGRLSEAAEVVATYQVVAFTSANGVERFFEALASAGKDARALAPCRVAAIGPATGAALRAKGIRPDIVAKDFRGEALADAILAAGKQLGGARVLIPRALEAREVLPEALRAAGMIVDVVPAYETRPVKRAALQPLKEALGRGRVDAILLTSSSTVTNLCSALGEDRELLGRTLLASIGPITTATAKELGLQVGVTAPEYTVPALVGALRTFWG